MKGEYEAIDQILNNNNKKLYLSNNGKNLLLVQILLYIMLK